MFSSPDLPNPGIEPTSLKSSALAGGFFTTSATQEAQWQFRICHTLKADTGEHWFGPYLLFYSISPSYHRMAHFAMNLDSREPTKITSEKEDFSTSEK